MAIAIGPEAYARSGSRDCLAFSTNIAWDSAGKPDTRPGCWGNADSADTPIVFQEVPAGKRVRILRVYGDWIMWPRGAIAPGSAAGGLTGLMLPACAQSPYVGPGLGAAGCFLYLQMGCGQMPQRAPIDITIRSGLLGADNTMILRLAQFLNETGASIHQETTLVVEFRFED